MYYLISADGKLNGPLSAADIHQWVAEGRASKYSRVRRQEDAEWQALGAIPELAPAPAPAPPAAPPPRPSEHAAPAGRPRLQEVIAAFQARAGTIDASRCVSRGWTLVRDNLLLLVGATVIVWSLIIGIALLPESLRFVGLLVNYPLLAGLYFIFLARLRGEPARVEDVFRGFRVAFRPLVVACCACSALEMLGLLPLLAGLQVPGVPLTVALAAAVLLSAPGVYLLVGYMFVVPLIVDRRLNVWAAMEVSRRVVHRHWWTAFALAIIASLIVAAGVLALGVGLLIAMPVATAALMAAYEDLFPR
jgi:hypothetical protein